MLTLIVEMRRTSVQNAQTAAPPSRRRHDQADRLIDDLNFLDKVTNRPWTLGKLDRSLPLVALPSGFAKLALFESWSTRLPAAVRTAVAQFLSKVRPGDPDDIGWLLGPGHQVLMQRVHAAGELTPNTTATYASRFRRAAQDFYHMQEQLPPRVTATAPDDVEVTKSVPRFSGGALGNVLTFQYRSPSKELDPREQLAEAFGALVRWPHLRRYLAPALIQAQDELEQRQRGGT